MPFWKKKPDAGGNAEVVSEAQLPKYAYDLFEASIPELIKKAERLSSQIDKDCEALQHAIHEFSVNDAKPKMDYVFQEKAVAQQKGGYISMLKGAVQSQPNQTGRTNYERFKLKAENADRIIKEIGGANFKFKYVVYGYVPQLGKVRNGFSELQTHTEELKKIMGADTGGAYERYLGAASLITELDDISETISVLKSTTGGQAQHDTVEDSRIQELEKNVEKERSALNDCEAEADKLRAKIMGYLSPLARTARKYDHVAKGKRGLSDFINDPIAEMATQEDFAKFEGMLDSMSKMISEGSLEDTGGIRARVTEIKTANLMQLVGQARTLQRSCQSMAHNLRQASLLYTNELEKARSIEAAKTNESMAKQRIIDLETEKNVVSLKICELIYGAYGRRITIA